jgi:excisionase family DNA binding protein
MEAIHLGTANQLRQRKTLLDASEVASILNCAKDTVYQWVKRYALPCVRFGDCMRFDPKQVADWLEAREATNQENQSEMSRDSETASNKGLVSLP